MERKPPEVKPSPETIRQMLEYQASTGVFVWKERLFGFKSIRDMNAWNTRYSGRPAGTKAKTGYVFITIGDKHFAAAQIAWVISVGEWPETDIDHKNGDPSDNRIENLRLTTRSENIANRDLQRNNKTGFKGVSYNKRFQKYYAQISMNGNRKHLGSFETAEDAADAYNSAAKEWHGEFARAASCRQKGR